MPSHFWTDQEIKVLGQLYPDPSISKEILKERFGRSWAAISMKARRLGLARPCEGSWSSEEIDQLRRIYPDPRVSLVQMVEYFGRSKQAIITRAYELHITRRAVEIKSWTPSENEQLRQLYINKNISAEFLKSVFGRSANAITKQARFLGLSRYDHQINHSYFQEIISDDQAYWLGWLAADGCFYKSHKPSRNDWTWYLLGTAPFLSAVRDRLEAQAQVRFRNLVRANKSRCPFLYKLSTSYKAWIRQIEAVLNPRGRGLSRKHL